MLEGEDLGEHILLNWRSFREGSDQEYPNSTSVYEKFDESGRSERCM
jgi:hypothetical protein